MVKKALIVLDKHGKEYELTSLWSNKKTVIVFLRHIGCAFCLELLQKINLLYHDLLAHDIGLVAVTLGTVKQLNVFLETIKFNGELFCEPDSSNSAIYQSYIAFNLIRGNESNQDKIITPLSLELYQNLIDNGIKSTPHMAGDEREYSSDVFQLGGLFVMGPGNSCDFSFRSEYVGHNPDVDEVLAAAIGTYPDGKTYTSEKSKKWSSFLKSGVTVESTAFVEPEVSPKFVKVKNSDYDIILLTLLCTFVFYLLKPSANESKQNLIINTNICARHENLTSSPKCPVKGSISSGLKVFSPLDIDNLVLENGLIACEGDEIMGSISMESYCDSSRLNDSPSQANFVRKRANTWDEGSVNEYQVMLCYFRDFLAKPSPLLGRSGPVCPFVPTAMKLNSIYLSVIRNASTKEKVYSYAEKCLDLFFKLEPNQGKTQMYKTIVLVFPDVLLENAHACIDQVQRELKPKFVAQGIMLGEFHMLNNSAGLHNPNFYPLRTPIPSLAIRFMAPSDIVFLAIDNYSSEVVTNLLESYILKFGERDSKEVELAKKKLEELKKDKNI